RPPPPRDLSPSLHGALPISADQESAYDEEQVDPDPPQMGHGRPLFVESARPRPEVVDRDHQDRYSPQSFELDDLPSVIDSCFRLAPERIRPTGHHPGIRWPSCGHLASAQELTRRDNATPAHPRTLPLLYP